MPPFIQWAHSQAMSGFIQLAHVGFHKGKGKTAHGISRIYYLHVAKLCAVGGWEVVRLLGHCLRDKVLPSP